MKISVIIPFYNIKNYVNRCLTSVVYQSYQDLEIILVNNGSTDGTADLLVEWAEKDERISVITKENEGPGKARNAGIAAATGEFITFIDGDDYVKPDYVTNLYEGITKGAEIAASDFHEVPDDQVYNLPNEAVKTELVSSKTAIEKFLTQEFNQSVWGMLYPRQAFDNTEFPDGYYEDMAIFYELLAKYDKVYFTTSKDYYYVQRSSSIMHENFSAWKMEILTVGKRVETFLNAEFPEVKQALYSRLFAAYSGVYMEIPAAVKFDENRQLLWSAVKSARQNLKIRQIQNKKVLLGVLSSYFGQKVFKTLFKFAKKK